MCVCVCVCVCVCSWQRGDNVPKVLVFSTDGDFLQAWNTSSLEMPHGIFLANASADPTVWITDVGNGGFSLLRCVCVCVCVCDVWVPRLCVCNTAVCVCVSGSYGHTVKQYSPSGKLLQVLGSPGKAGSSLSPLQFDQPAEIFVHSSGEIYIVDGDGGMNNRLIKLSRGVVSWWFLASLASHYLYFYTFTSHEKCLLNWQYVCISIILVSRYYYYSF